MAATFRPEDFSLRSIQEWKVVCENLAAAVQDVQNSTSSQKSVVAIERAQGSLAKHLEATVETTKLVLTDMHSVRTCAGVLLETSRDISNSIHSIPDFLEIERPKFSPDYPLIRLFNDLVNAHTALADSRRHDESLRTLMKVQADLVGHAHLFLESCVLVPTDQLWFALFIMFKTSQDSNHLLIKTLRFRHALVTKSIQNWSYTADASAAAGLLSIKRSSLQFALVVRRMLTEGPGAVLDDVLLKSWNVNNPDSHILRHTCACRPTGRSAKLIDGQCVTCSDDGVSLCSLNCWSRLQASNELVDAINSLDAVLAEADLALTSEATGKGDVSTPVPFGHEAFVPWVVIALNVCLAGPSLFTKVIDAAEISTPEMVLLYTLRASRTVGGLDALARQVVGQASIDLPQLRQTIEYYCYKHDEVHFKELNRAVHAIELQTAYSRLKPIVESLCKVLQKSHSNATQRQIIDLVKQGFAETTGILPAAAYQRTVCELLLRSIDSVPQNSLNPAALYTLAAMTSQSWHSNSSDAWRSLSSMWQESCGAMGGVTLLSTDSAELHKRALDYTIENLASVNLGEPFSTFLFNQFVLPYRAFQIVDALFEAPEFLTCVRAAAYLAASKFAHQCVERHATAVYQGVVAVMHEIREAIEDAGQRALPAALEVLATRSVPAIEDDDRREQNIGILWPLVARKAEKGECNQKMIESSDHICFTKPRVLRLEAHTLHQPKPSPESTADPVVPPDDPKPGQGFSFMGLLEAAKRYKK